MLLAKLPSEGPVANTLRNTMGLTQLITASIGSVISGGIIKLGLKNKINN